MKKSLIVIGLFIVILFGVLATFYAPDSEVETIKVKSSTEGITLKATGTN